MSKRLYHTTSIISTTPNKSPVWVLICHSYLFPTFRNKLHTGQSKGRQTFIRTYNDTNIFSPYKISMHSPFNALFILLTAQNLPHIEQLSSCSGARLSRISSSVLYSFLATAFISGVMIPRFSASICVLYFSFFFFLSNKFIRQKMNSSQNCALSDLSLGLSQAEQTKNPRYSPLLFEQR